MGKTTSADKFTSEYVTVSTPICSNCEYRDDESVFRCLAFPKGIPLAISMNEADHTKPYKGDHGIQFKAKT